MGIASLILCAMMEMPTELSSKLEKYGVAPNARVLVVSVKDQRMTLFEDGKPKAEFIVSTARKGTGQKEHTFQTPLGLHRIKQKIGKDLPKGAIFEERVFKGQIWVPLSTSTNAPPVSSTNEESRAAVGEPVESDLITSRILWLEGMEPGHNSGNHPDGGMVDSYRRFIYIHGTNHESDIGKPASHGCIRLSNEQVISLYDQVEEGDLVWIQE